MELLRPYAASTITNALIAMGFESAHAVALAHTVRALRKDLEWLQGEMRSDRWRRSGVSPHRSIRVLWPAIGCVPAFSVCGVSQVVWLNSKPKTLNSKQIQNLNFQMFKTTLFRDWDFDHLSSFRVSDLGFRVSVPGRTGP